MKTGAVIVAGGKGLRVGGDLPKQLQLFGEKRLFQYSLDVFTNHPVISSVALVVPEDSVGQYAPYTGGHVTLALGGETRSQSVRSGLIALALSDGDAVLIHDAARPGITSAMIDVLIEALNDADASAPALPISDAVKRKNIDGLETVDRSPLVRVQTPQAFRYGLISKALSEESNAVDDLQAIEDMAGTVKLIDGHETLNKITHLEDFTLMSRLLLPQDTMRVGTGFDVHAFGPGDHVTLCGVRIAHTQSLAGHSDADVAWHALTDAILGAAALGDIGDHFPPSDPQWKGAASSLFLKHAQKLAAGHGYAVQSCDLTIICEAPKVKPHREAMRESTATLLGLDLSQVSVKATTTEGLGFTGRGEGIAAQACAVLSRPGRNELQR